MMPFKLPNYPNLPSKTSNLLKILRKFWKKCENLPKTDVWQRESGTNAMISIFKVQMGLRSLKLRYLFTSYMTTYKNIYPRSSLPRRAARRRPRRLNFHPPIRVRDTVCHTFKYQFVAWKIRNLNRQK